MNVPEPVSAEQPPMGGVAAPVPAPAPVPLLWQQQRQGNHWNTLVKHIKLITSTQTLNRDETPNQENLLNR